MPLDPSERAVIETVIAEAQDYAAKYLETGADLHKSVLKVSVNQTMDILDSYSDSLRDDEYVDNYRLHMLVPLQILKLIENEENKENEND